MATSPALWPSFAPAKRPPLAEPPPPPPPPPPDLFGTVALPAPATRMAACWAAVRDAVVSSPVLDQLAAGAFALDPGRRIAAAQSIVNRRIAYRNDAQWWGLEDYWASADQTAMLHRLGRFGITPDQFYLSVGQLDGKARARGDHAVALVVLAGRWWVLDDRFDRPVAADRLTGFTPVPDLRRRQRLGTRPPASRCSPPEPLKTQSRRGAVETARKGVGCPAPVRCRGD